MLEVDGFSGKANVLGLVRRVSFSGGVLSVEGLGYADAREVLAALDVDRLRSVPELSEAPTGGRAVYQERTGIAGEGVSPVPGPVVRLGVAEAQARPVVHNHVTIAAPAAAPAGPPWEAPAPAPRPVTPNTIPPQVCSAKDLRPVVEWLWAGSHQLPEAQVETMKQLADTGHVPLLATMFATMPEDALFAEVVATMRALGYATDGTARVGAPAPAVAPPAPAPSAPATSTPPSPPAASPGAAAAHAEAPSGVPEVVKKAQHLRVVVDYVVERLPKEQRGSLDAVTRGVSALSAEVPMVARIESAKLRGRVERTMTAMDLLPTA